MNSDGIVLAFTDADTWRLGIGDPTFVGWFTVFAYFLAAWLTFRVARRCATASAQRNRERTFWLILTVVLVALGINKQLDLQTWFTLTGRRMARSEGWYESRRIVQFVFIFFIAFASIAGFFGLRRFIRRESRQLRIPLFGLCLLLGFVVIRAASFHHVDQFLHFSLLGFKMNWLLELGGIAVVACGALLNTPRVKPARPVMRARVA